MIRKLLLGTALALALAAPAFAFVPTYADEADVLGKGSMELFFSLESASYEGGVDVTELESSFTYGLNDKWDLWAELPYAVDDGFDQSGLGDLTLGAKWAFGSLDKWELALSPYLTLATGDEDKGLGAGKTNFGAAFIASLEMEPWTLTVNLDLFTANSAAEDETGWALAVMAAYGLDDWWTLVGEITLENEGGEAENTLLLGASYTITEDIELGGGLKLGLNDNAPDTSFLLGVTIGL